MCALVKGGESSTTLYCAPPVQYFRHINSTNIQKFSKVTNYKLKYKITANLRTTLPNPTFPRC